MDFRVLFQAYEKFQEINKFVEYMTSLREDLEKNLGKELVRRMMNIFLGWGLVATTVQYEIADIMAGRKQEDNGVFTEAEKVLHQYMHFKTVLAEILSNYLLSGGKLPETPEHDSEIPSDGSHEHPETC